MRRSGIAAAAIALAGACSSAAPLPDAVTAQRYRIVTETVMPHLEENLRYATRTEERCVARDELSTAFWMLGEAPLRDCRLVAATDPRSTGDSATYVLSCDGGHGTTGTASWHVEAARAAGMLQVRLGGKNMTFSQRAVATPLGGC